MKLLYSILGFISFSNLSIAQNANVIFQVNDVTLREGEISNLYLKFSEDPKAKIYSIRYYPGDLVLSEEISGIIKSDTVDKFILHFDFYTYKNHEQQIANFDIQLNKKLLEGPYLIIDVYDFRDKKYKHWYQYHTKENYLVQLIYPQSGLYVRRKLSRLIPQITMPVSNDI